VSVNGQPTAFSLGCFALEHRSFPGLVVSGRVLDLTRTPLVGDDATGVNDLLEDWDALVLVDALPDRGAPGTVHVFEADHETLAPTAGLEAHSIDPAAVFGTLKALGGTAPRTIVVGCEVADIDEGMDLSHPVAAAVPDAVAAMEDVLSGLVARQTASAREG